MQCSELTFELNDGTKLCGSVSFYSKMIELKVTYTKRVKDSYKILQTSLTCSLFHCFRGTSLKQEDCTFAHTEESDVTSRDAGSNCHIAE